MLTPTCKSTTIHFTTHARYYHEAEPLFPERRCLVYGKYFCTHPFFKVHNRITAHCHCINKENDTHKILIKCVFVGEKKWV